MLFLQTEKAKSSYFDRTRGDKNQIFPTLLLVLLFRLIFLLLKLLGKFWPLLLPIEVLFTATAQWYIVWVSKIQIYIMKIKAAYLLLTLSGMGRDIFTPLSLLDQILSAEFFSKISKLSEVKIEINRVILTPCPAH